MQLVRERDLIIPDQRKVTIHFLRILVFHSASSLFKSFRNFNQKCTARECQVQVSFSRPTDLAQRNDHHTTLKFKQQDLGK